MERLRLLLDTVKASNRFYQRKLAGIEPSRVSISDLPFTTKAELVADQAASPPYGTNHSEPLQRYTRLHQSSGTTTGQPLRWLDTPANWDWLLHCWSLIFKQIQLQPGDRLFFPFSFGPFLGFWTAFEAGTRTGYRCLAGGGMSSTARLRFMLENEATVLFATPTYALHLAEVADKEKIAIAESSVRAIIVAGEPGGSIETTRSQLEEAWGARVFDHYGMTEIGPVAVETVDSPRNQTILGSEYIAEVVDVKDGIGELVLTNLGRTASPLIRYRTGDLVKQNAAGQLEGGILGRMDDMLHIRGNNIYPGSIEAIVRRFVEIGEYRLIVDRGSPLADLGIEIETKTPGLAAAVAKAIGNELLFRAEVVAVPPGSLPRFELKARRVVQKK
jgi:phenylacetate-CoA ligase